jgi:hypothetical protein
MPVHSGRLDTGVMRRRDPVWMADFRATFGGGARMGRADDPRGEVAAAAAPFDAAGPAVFYLKKVDR